MIPQYVDTLVLHLLAKCLIDFQKSIEKKILKYSQIILIGVIVYHDDKIT